MQCLHWGKITFVGRSDVAAQVLKSKSFVNRLGSQHGLKLLGMHEEGIIWNNNNTGWQEKRKYFADVGKDEALKVVHQVADYFKAAGKLSQQAVQQLALEMLLAGTDTSSISLYYLMVQLSDDPQLEQQLLAAVGDIHQLSDMQLAAALPTSAGDDARLPKCQASLCEALRFKPVGQSASAKPQRPSPSATKQLKAAAKKSTCSQATLSLAIIDVLAYATERWGIQSAECGPVDDGVRMTTPTADLMVAFEVVMQQQGVPYDVVRSSSVHARVGEVLGLLGVGK
ncbi:hypothetical protein OEZ86_000146 [Tetradesmus obliquus]|nr:hypothetical protein OEZ86_000146 [Tetradesmus obliquus]